MSRYSLSTRALIRENNCFCLPRALILTEGITVFTTNIIPLSDTSNPGRQLYTHAILRYVRENRSSESKMAHQRVNKASCRGLLHRVSLAGEAGLPQGRVLSPSPFFHVCSQTEQAQREGSACPRGECSAGDARTPRGCHRCWQGTSSPGAEAARPGELRGWLGGTRTETSARVHPSGPSHPHHQHAGC